MNDCDRDDAGGIFDDRVDRSKDSLISALFGLGRPEPPEEWDAWGDSVVTTPMRSHVVQIGARSRGPICRAPEVASVEGARTPFGACARHPLPLPLPPVPRPLLSGSSVELPPVATMARTSRALKGIVVALCVLCTVAAATAGGVCYFVMVAAPSPASPGVVPVTIAEDIPVVIAPDRTDQQQAGKTKRAMPRKPRVQREHAAVDELLAAGVEAGRKVRVGRKPAVVPVDDILAAGMQGARKSTTPGPRRRASSGSPASSGQPTVDEDERDDRTGEVALINSVY